MRLELRHEMFFMVLCTLSVTELVMVPVLFSKGQYLHWMWLQKEWPRLFGSVPRRLEVVDGVLVPPVSRDVVVLGVKKSVIDFCEILPGGGLMGVS